MMPKKNNSFKIVSSIILIVLLVWFFNLPPVNLRAKNFFYKLVYPAQKLFWETNGKINSLKEKVRGINSLEQANEFLKKENQLLVNEIAVLESLESENQELKKALGLGIGADFKTVLAEVFSKDSSDSSIFINKGQNNGLAKGMAVLTPEKVLVGKISKTYGDFSEVSLFFSANNSFAARVLGKDVSGIVKGDGRDIFLEILFGKDEIISGDKLVTDIAGGVYPKNLLIGDIIGLRKNDLEAVLGAEISSALDLGKTNRVFVILGVNLEDNLEDGK